MTICKIFFVVVRSFTADSNLLQPTGDVNSTPHTSHFLVDSHLTTRTCVAQAQVWRAQRTFHIISCVILRLLPFPLLAVYLLSYHPVFPPGHQLLLPRCGGQIPCALLLMRTSAPLPCTTLSQVMTFAVVGWANLSFSTPCGKPQKTLEL